MGRGASARDRPASVTGVHDVDEEDYAKSPPTRRKAQMLFTSVARDAGSSIKKALVPLSQKPVIAKPFLQGDHSSSMIDKGHDELAEERKVNLPAITKLLKPKDADHKRRRTKLKEGQERAKSVDLTNNRIDEAEQKLKRELAALSTRAKEAGFVVNTGKLWRQSNFQPPGKNCQQIKERKAAFLDWKETASIELQQTRLMHLGQQIEEGVEDPMISPRDMTEAQAERALKMLHKTVVKLAKEANDNKDLRRRTERNLATLKAETLTAAGKQMKGIEEEAARLELAKEHCLDQLAEVEAHSKERDQQRRHMQHLEKRLKDLCAQDDKVVAAMQKDLKKHHQDLEALREQMKQELPVVQKTLMANDLHATKLVVESIRVHYSKELEAKRQEVRDAAALRLQVIEAEERKKKIEEELRLMYDPTVDSPRRNELKRKLQMFEETLEMMMMKLGDVSVDRITALFTQMKHSKSTWDDAVRDAEARCEELRREHNVLQEALKSVYEREAAPAGDVQRRIHELKGQLEIKMDKGSEGERKLTQQYQLMALARSGLESAMRRVAKVANMPVAKLVQSASDLDHDDDDDHNTLDRDLPMLVTQYQQQVEKIIEHIRNACNDTSKLPNFKGFAPVTLMSTSSTVKHPVMISIESGDPEEMLGIKVPVLASPVRTRTAESLAHQAKSSGGKSESPPKQPVAVLNEEGQEAKDTQKTEESADVAKAQDPAAPGEEGSVSVVPVEGESGMPEKAGDEEEKAGKEIVDETGYENDSFETLETLEAEKSYSSLGSPGARSRHLRPAPRAPPVDGVADLGLFADKDIHEAVASITFPKMELQRRVKFPKRMRRKDKRNGMQFCSDSDTQHSTGSETSFDYEEIEEELAIDIYAEREAAKRRAAKLERQSHTRKKEEPS